MFEIQDVGGANIYPLEYILLAGIFDRPPPPLRLLVPAADRFFISVCVPTQHYCV